MLEAATVRESARFSAKQGLLVVAIYCVTLLLVFHQTVGSIVSIWLRSGTYAHGFLILPISLWLIWEKRERIFGFGPQPSFAVALLMLPLGFGWLVAWLVDVLVIQQLALVGLLIVGVWAVLGHKMTRVLAFPLGFLFLAVPMGEAFIPPMMEFTATSTVWLIQQSGIPVFREGMYFTLPSGNWSVVEACSGVRYLIASFTLGLLYAYLTYRSPWRQGAFVIVSIIFPIIANTLRAYGIVMLGHFSDMTIAVGVDHLIYGWVFFGVVMMLLFWVGSIFREESPVASNQPTGARLRPSEPQSSLRGLWTVSLVALLMAAVWPLLSTLVGGRPIDEPIDLNSAQGGWQPVLEAQWAWAPNSTVSGLSEAYYRQSDSTVGVFVQYASAADDRGDVVGSITRFVEHRSPHLVVAQNFGSVQLPHTKLSILEAVINSRGEQYLAWSWYRIGNRSSTSNYRAKLQQALSRLGLGAAGSYRLVLATKVGAEGQENARQVLRRFLEGNLSDIEHRIDKTGSGG